MSLQHTTLLVSSSDVFTSAINIQPGGRFAVGIYIGSAVSDPVISAMSATFQLQKKYGSYLESDSDGNFWRPVKEWSVNVADGLDDNVEEISAEPEAEYVQYRVGCISYSTGLAALRIGTGY